MFHRFTGVISFLGMAWLVVCFLFFACLVCVCVFLFVCCVWVASPTCEIFYKPKKLPECTMGH